VLILGNISFNPVVINKYFYFLLLSIYPFFYCSAQSDSVNLYDLDLYQLSKLKITSASKVVENKNEISTWVNIITAAEIKRNGYFTLEEALSTLPGFQFRNIQGINSYIFQRGIPNQNNLTLVLIDGIQINELNSGGFYAGGQYNLSNVERIEVMYGPSSVAYGTNAVSGIINIITKNPTQNNAEVNVLLGSFNTSKVDLNYSYTNTDKTLGILLSGMLKRTNKANLKEAEGDYNWTKDLDNFEKDYSFDVKIKYKDLLFGTNFLQEQTSTATLDKTINTNLKDYGTSWNIRFVNNYLKYNFSFLEKFNVSTVFYNRNTTVLDNTIYYVTDTSQIGYYRPNNLTGFESILNYNAGNIFSVTAGISFEYEKLAKYASLSYSNSQFIKPPKPLTPPSADNTLFSLFLEPKIILFDSLFISGGLRFDKSSIYDQVFTPRFGLNYNINRNIIRLSYGESFRAPKPWDYSDGLGNSSLDPEKMKSLEIGASFFIAHNYRFDLIGYINKLEKAITKEITNLGYRWINSGEVYTKGFEVVFKYLSTNLESNINYTFTESTFSDDRFVPEISKHSGNLNITYFIDKNININLRANYIGERENLKLITATNSNKIPAYVIFHGSISLLNYMGFDIQIALKNILNTEYYHTSNRTVERYRQSQRTIMLSIGYLYNY